MGDKIGFSDFLAVMLLAAKNDIERSRKTPSTSEAMRPYHVAVQERL